MARSETLPSARAGERAPTGRSATRTGRGTRYPRSAAPPVLVEVRRGTTVESRHRGHVVQVDVAGRVERGIGDPDALVTLRSAVKPFALLALLEAGADEPLRLSSAELAVMTGSHSGEDSHVRTLHGVLRRAGLSQTLLACGAEGMPLDAVTAGRLARDGETPGPIRHMCSGFHVASLILARHGGWTLADYWRPEHPTQMAVREQVATVFGVRPSALRAAVDACGLQTYAFPLADVARAFCLLADPDQATDAARLALAPNLKRIRDAMIAEPSMVGGTRDSSDTRLMVSGVGRIVAKGGAEGLRGIGLLPGSRGKDSAAAGVAIKIEDGDLGGRANRAVSVEALQQLGALDALAVERLADLHRPPARDPRRTEVGQSVARFELAPISELV